MRRHSIAVAGIALALALAHPALAQYGGGARLSSSSASSGSAVTVGGSGFAPGAGVVITFESDPVVLGSVRADSSGSFSTVVTIPEDAEPGRHVIRARGEAAGGGILELTSPITVAGEAARAGATALLVLVAVLGLAAIGVAMIAAQRRFGSRRSA